VNRLDDRHALAEIYLHRDHIEAQMCLGMVDDVPTSMQVLAQLAGRLRATIQIGLESAYAQDAPRASLLQSASHWQRRLHDILPEFDWGALWSPFSAEEEQAQRHELSILQIEKPAAATATGKGAWRGRHKTFPPFDPKQEPVYKTPP
jgi:hypothetical protein